MNGSAKHKAIEYSICPVIIKPSANAIHPVIQKEQSKGLIDVRFNHSLM